MVLADQAAQEAVWLQKLNSDLLGKNITIIVIYEDYQSAMCIAKSSISQRRTNHIEIKYHFIVILWKLIT